MSIVIPEIIGDIVAKVNTIVLPKLQEYDSRIVNVNYLYGVPPEITKTLTQWIGNDTTEAKRFPLVALIQPFTETKGSLSGIDSQTGIRLIIAHRSMQEWHTPERYAKTFKPILYPIYEELLRQIILDSRIESQQVDLISTQKTDWPFWDDGKDTNPFNEILDVVELRELRLKFKTENCYK